MNTLVFRLARLPTLLAVLAIVSPLASAEPLQQSGNLRFSAPTGWTSIVDPNSGLVSLITPGNGVSITFAEGAEYAGTAEEWQSEMWSGVQQQMKIKAPATPGRRGEFLTLSAACEKADGTPIWICLYSVVKNGRGEGIFLFARSEEGFRANIATADHLVAGVAFAPPMNTTTPSESNPGTEEQALNSTVRYSPPPGWVRVGNLAAFHTADQHASMVVGHSADFTGTPEQWHAQNWSRVLEGKKIKGAATKGRRGNFLSTWAAFDRADGGPFWICVYSAVHDGRGEAVVFNAEQEAAFKANLPVIDHMVDGITFASAQGGPVAASTAPVPSISGSNAAGANGLVVNLPAGWTQKQDPQSKVIFMLPPDAHAAKTNSDSEIVIMPATEFSGTAEEWHESAVKFALREGKLLEPAHKAATRGLLISLLHHTDAKAGEIRTIVYTARWGTRAQMFVFFATHEDMFVKYAQIADQAISQVVIPGGANPSGVSGQASSFPVGGLTGGGMIAPSAAGESNPNDAMPVLQYNDPPNFFRGSSGGKAYAEFQGSDVNFTLCTYPFKEFSGDIRSTFQQTLLRDWIGVMHQEEGVASPPQFTNYKTPGADAAIGARFLDARQQEHFRLLLVAGRSAALVDMYAPTAFAYQKGFTSAVQLLDSMHVGKTAAPPPLKNGPGPDGAKLAGLFQGFKGKTVSNLMLGAGYLSMQNALHFFLFSADGRVYRCYDFPPGGSIDAARHFNFDTAERQDPGNAGRFAVRGNELYIKMGGPNADEITATVSEVNTLQLDGVTYQRKP